MYLFEIIIKLTFVNQSLVCIPVWIEHTVPVGRAQQV